MCSQHNIESLCSILKEKEKEKHERGSLIIICPREREMDCLFSWSLKLSVRRSRHIRASYKQLFHLNNHHAADDEAHFRLNSKHGHNDGAKQKRRRSSNYCAHFHDAQSRQQQQQEHSTVVVFSFWIWALRDGCVLASWGLGSLLNYLNTRSHQQEDERCKDLLQGVMMRYITEWENSFFRFKTN